jgi:hypothetical protein
MWAAVALGVAWASPAAAASLPDGRGYELVSTGVRSGVDVVPQTDKTHVRPDGNAVTFATWDALDAADGSAFELERIGKRSTATGTSAWSSHGITPLAQDTTVTPAADGSFPSYVDGFTSDLSVGIYKTSQPLTNAPNVAEVANLYRIASLGDDAATAQLMTDSVNPLPAGWLTFFDGFFVRLIQPQFAGASSELRHVVFESRLRLTADAPPYPAGLCATFGFACPTQLYENADGVVRFVGRIPQAPDTACDDAVGPACVSAASSQTALSATSKLYSKLAVSRDGRRILFQAPADASSGAIYLREDATRTEQIAADGELWTASADATRAFFTTADALVPADTDSSPDLYLYDRNAPAGSRLTLISSGSSGIDGYAETVVGASADGGTVYFVFDGQLIAGEPPVDALGLYAWHDGQLSFIGAFQSLQDAFANGPRTSWSSVATARTSRVTPDGEHLLFMTTSDAGFAGRGGFAGYDHAGHRELYLYSAETGSLACASCNPSGSAATADTAIDVRESETSGPATSDSARALTDDGRRVFFNTAEALVADDVNDTTDAYEYDAETGTVHLLSSGRGATPSYVVDATASGDDAFVVTRERLLARDGDDRYDLYDARVGGGVPGPLP